MLALTGLITGVLLGLRYKVLSLVPAMITAVLIGAAIGVTGQQDLWAVSLLTVSGLAALQIGYLIGLVAQTVWKAGAPKQTVTAVAGRTR